MRIKEALNNGCQLLREFKLPSAELDAELLLAHSLSKSRSDLYSHSEISLTPAQRKNYRQLLARRASSEPVAYLVSQKEFYGYPFFVNNAVLIPRPETETLVEQVIDNARTGGYLKPRILEIGTGSGAVAISVAKQLGKARLTAADVSREALKLARKNARDLKVNQRIKFVHSDLLSNIRGRFDIIAANLPYLTTAQMQELPRDIKKYEPKLALNGGPDGLYLYNQLLKQLTRITKPGSTLLCEIGPNIKIGFEMLVKNILPTNTKITFHQDLAGRTRVVRVVLVTMES